MHFAAMLMLAAGCAFGQDTMVLSSGSALPGNTVSLNLSLSVVSGSAPASLEWTFSYSAGDFTAVSVVPGPVAVAAGKSVSCSGSPGSYRCLLFGINSTALSDGIVATATFTVSPTTTSTSSTIQVINSSGAMLSGIPVSITAIGGLVMINPLYAVTGLICSPATVTTPGSATCTVTVSAPAPTAGLAVNTGIVSTASVTIPSSVTIAAGSAAGEFTVTAAAVNTGTGAVVSAGLTGSPADFSLTLAPSPNNSLAADWKLGEPSGAISFADASENGNTGSCSSACPTLGVAGKVGTAASFNGSQIIVPDSPSLRLNQFTIALWVFPTQEKNDYQTLVAKEDSSAANRNYALYIVPNSLHVRYAVWAGDCATKLAANSNGQMVLNTWNYIVFTYDGVTEELYLNGVLDNATAAPAATLCQAAVPVKIGMETSAFLPFSGSLDDVRIYSQPLTAAQVSSLYYPLAADWKLDEPSGAASFADASGNSNSGSCTSACPTLGVAGNVGTAASFNGSQIIVPDSPSLRLNQFTIALWVFPTQEKSDYQTLVAKEDSTAANRKYAMYIVPNSLQLRYAVWAGDCATKLAANSTGQMVLNAWNYVVFTYDGATEKLYLNGALDSTIAGSLRGLCQAAVPVKIGMESSAFLPFSGSLDDIQIYSQALTAARVVSLYNPPVADWKLGEHSGAISFADASENGNTGSCGSACPALGVAGNVGTAASFNGSSQIIVPDSPSLRLNQFTIALWVFPTQEKSDYQTLVAKEDSSAANRNYALYIVPNSLHVRYAVWAGDCATKLAASSTGQMVLNTWNYIVFTYDGVTEEFYLNGVLDSANAAPAATLCQAAVPVKIGMETSAFLPFSGSLDDIQIYSQALTEAQVATLYNPMAAEWRLGEPSGAASFADASGNGNSGSCGSACPTLGVAGKVGTAASFNGSQIIVPDSPSLRLNQFTIALWVFPTQEKSDYQTLVAKEDSSAANRNYALYIVPNSLRVRYAVWAGDCATKLAANSNGQMVLNTWNYIVFTYDGVTEEFYLNGVLDSANAAPAATLCQAAVPVKIGMETSAFLPFSGTLDDVRIYSQALTESEVAALFGL